MKRSTQLVFRNAAAAKRMAAHYRKQMGLGLDGQPRRYGPKKKALAKEIQHGVNCPQEAHTSASGYLHAPGDDRPYDVDGVSYCGRCHKALAKERSE